MNVEGITLNSLIEHGYEEEYAETVFKNPDLILEKTDGNKKVLMYASIVDCLEEYALNYKGKDDKWIDYHESARRIISAGVTYTRGLTFGHDLDNGIDSQFNADYELYCYSVELYLANAEVLRNEKRYFAASSKLYLAQDCLKVLSLMLSPIFATVCKMDSVENAVYQYCPKTSRKFKNEERRREVMINLGKDIIAMLTKKVQSRFTICTLCVFQELPEKYHRYYAGIISLSVKNEYVDPFLIESKNLIHQIEERYPNCLEDLSYELEKLLPNDLTETDPSPKVKRYRLWCESHGLFLSNLVFFPVAENCLVDEMSIEETDPFILAVFQDLKETYLHSRYLIYSGTTDNHDADIAYDSSPETERCLGQEKMIDCFVRCYSVFDKIAHLLAYKFEMNLTKVKNNQVVDVDPYFSEVSRIIREKYSSNPYLNVIPAIYNELSPYIKNYKKVPALERIPDSNRLADIRNNITHGAIKIVQKESEINKKLPVLQITEKDFSIQIMNVLSLTREAIMTTFMAIDFENRHVMKSNWI